MTDNMMINLAILLLTGLLFSKLAKLVKFPNVTGYLIGGLLIGPAIPAILNFGDFHMTDFYSGLVNEGSLNSLNVICDVALAFIAFTIGAGFKLSYFKVVGAKPVIIAILEAVMATIFVFAGCMLAGKGVAFSLVLSAIAAATAPAATLMVVKQYKARGSLTDTLLSVVAIDDAVALVVFGFNFTIAANILSVGASSRPLALSFAMPFIEIIASLLIGAIIGYLVVLMLRWFKGRSNRICIIIAALLATIGINALLNKTFDMNISNLLSAMMVGAMLANLSKEYDVVVPLVERFTPAFFMLFFVISGAELNLSTVASVGLVGIIYIVIRVVGKWVGASLGGIITKADSKVKKYLGPCLIPQAGVAIGLSLVAEQQFGATIGGQIRTVILAATLIYELIGPLVAKITLRKAGEIAPEGSKPKIVPTPSV